MANQGVPTKGAYKSEGTGISNHGGIVNDLDEKKSNSIGIPYGQAPGIGGGMKENSMNQLPSNARVVKSATSNLMTGMSQNRGTGGNK